jgi:hypothetical protein
MYESRYQANWGRALRCWHWSLYHQVNSSRYLQNRRSGSFRNDINVFMLTVIERGILGHIARSPVVILTEMLLLRDETA